MDGKITVQLKGSSNLDRYHEAILAVQEELKKAKIELKVYGVNTRIVDSISILVITITGAVASHYIIKLVDALTKKKREKVNDNVKILIVYQFMKFNIPEEYEALLEQLDEDKKA